MAEAGHEGTWWCSRRERASCPPEGCPKHYGCARDHGWESGDPSPRECQGLPPSPPQAPQDMAELMTAARRATGLVFSNPYPRASAAAIKQMERAETEAWDALAAALTPRELTDEEAERGARALTEHAYAMRGLTLSDNEWLGLRAGCMDGVRAVYRAITEEPARTAPPHTPDRP